MKAELTATISLHRVGYQFGQALQIDSHELHIAMCIDTTPNKLFFLVFEIAI